MKKLFTWWIFVFVSLVFLECQSLKLDLLKDDEKIYCVVTNETESTAVVITKNNKLVKHSRYDGYPKDSFYCEPSYYNTDCKDMFKGSRWIFAYSHFNNLEPITDRRWEDIGWYPPMVNYFYWYYSFSVLHSGENPRKVLIYLYDKWNNPQYSYNITIPHMEDASVCLWQRNNTHNCNSIKPITTSKIDLTSWNHFNLNYKNSSYILTEKYTNFTLSFRNDTFAPWYIDYKQSKEVTWKHLHYNFFAAGSSRKSIDIKRGEKDEKICVAVFARTCGNSRLILDLNNISETKTIMTEKVWKELKLETVLKENTSIKLNIELNWDNCWSFIGEIRDCSYNKRVVSVKYTESENLNEYECTSIGHPITKAKKMSTRNMIISTPSYADPSSIDLIWPRTYNNQDLKLESMSFDKDCLNGSKELLRQTSSLSLLSTTSIKLLPNTYYKFSLVNEKGEIISSISIPEDLENDFIDCAMYIDEQNFSSESNNDNKLLIIIIIVSLVLLCLSLGTTIYFMYQTKKTTCKSSCVLNQEEPQNSFSMNISKTDNVNFSHPIPSDKFHDYVNNPATSIEIFGQYRMVESLGIKSQSEGVKPENIKKNRYQNLLPYDDNLVILNNQGNKAKGDYINASYINGFNREKAFIAAQTPLASTIRDFWKMILQENVECIINLSKLSNNKKGKSEIYWPEINEVIQCNLYKLTCTNVKITNGIKIRTIQISTNSIERQVTQIHYEEWSDKDVPSNTTPIKNILHIMNKFLNKNPIVIHCSGGVGQTGTLILCSIAASMSAATENIDMFSILYYLRQQRPEMVQTLDQYRFAYKVVAEITALYEEV